MNFTQTIKTLGRHWCLKTLPIQRNEPYDVTGGTKIQKKKSKLYQSTVTNVTLLKHNRFSNKPRSRATKLMSAAQYQTVPFHLTGTSLISMMKSKYSELTRKTAGVTFLARNVAICLHLCQVLVPTYVGRSLPRT